MKITISTGPERKKPKTGDKRTTKKHGLQVRVPSMVKLFGGGLAYDCTGGRQNYEWKTPKELIGSRWEHLLTKEELHAASDQKL